MVKNVLNSIKAARLERWTFDLASADWSFPLPQVWPLGLAVILDWVHSSLHHSIVGVGKLVADDGASWLVRQRFSLLWGAAADVLVSFAQFGGTAFLHVHYIFPVLAWSFHHRINCQIILESNLVLVAWPPCSNFSIWAQQDWLIT